MASAIIHLAIAKELEKEFNIKNRKDYYLGSIAPDIAKQIGETKDKSHFIINTDKDIPNLDIYTTKYKKFKKNDFELGYFIHLYTDKLWYEEFMPKIAEGTSIKLLDGTIINAKEEQITNMIYTNINIQIIENHNMDLSLFYEEFQKPKTIIDEIPIDKLDILINKMGIIIENSKQEQTYSFDTYLVEDFINKRYSKKHKRSTRNKILILLFYSLNNL